MAQVISIFQASPEPQKSGFDLDKLTEQFRSHRNTDWTVPEAFICLLLSAASADGQVTREEQAEIHALANRSRALKSLSPAQLASVNATVSERLRSRPEGLREACESLPADMRLTVFAHCADIILSDGALVAVEADFLNRIVALMGLDAADGKRVLEVLLVKNRF